MPLRKHSNNDRLTRPPDIRDLYLDSSCTTIFPKALNKISKAQTCYESSNSNKNIICRSAIVKWETAP